MKSVIHHIRIITLLFFLQFNATMLLGQGTEEMMFRHIREDDGLSYNIVNCIFRDSHGFMWIGSYNGLNRFDGAHFQVYKSARRDPHALINNVVHAVCEDKLGRIWCATDDGISCLNVHDGGFTNFTSHDGIAFNFCFNIICDHTGMIWFSGRRGLYSIAPEDFTITHFPHTEDVNSPPSHFYYKNGMILDPVNNVLWCGGYAGLLSFNCSTHKCISHTNTGTENVIYHKSNVAAMCLSEDGKLFWSDLDREKIFFFHLDQPDHLKEVVLTDAEKKLMFEMSTLFCDRENNLWLSSWNYNTMGIDLRTNKRITLSHSDDNPLSIGAEFFWDVWQSDDGALWFGTVNGISVTNPAKQFYTISDFGNEAKDGLISAVFKTKDGIICLGMSDGRLILKQASGRVDVIALPPAVTEGDEYKPVVGFLETVNGLVVYSQQGMWYLDAATPELHALNIPEATNRGDVHMGYIAMERDSVLWIPCYPKGVLSYRMNSKQSHFFKSESDSSDFQQAFIVAADAEGNIYSTDRTPNLFVLKKGNNLFKKIELDSNILAELKTEIITDLDIQNGKLYLAHKGAGMLVFDPVTHQLRHFDESDGMLFNAAMAAGFDQQSRYWIAAYNKISVFRQDETFSNFSLPVEESAYRYINTIGSSADGHLLFGFEDEIVEVIPERFDLSVALPAPLISSVHCADSTFLIIDNAQGLDLGIYQNYFTVDFAQLFAHYDNTSYYYQLSGLSDDWVNAGKLTNAYFTNLSGGDYIFRVKAVLNNVESPVTELSIHIETIFYKRWWFIALCISIILLLTFIFLWNRARQRNLVHELAINNERLQREKATVQYDNLTNQLNPHFLFNSLSSLDSLIQDDKVLASDFLQHLSRVYRYVLQNTDRETVSLKTELDFIANYVFLLETRFQSGFEIKYNVRDEDMERELVPVTLQILVENAVKHNIITMTKPLQIMIESDGQFVIVKNTLRRKSNVETSNKQGMEKLKTLYRYITEKEIVIEEDENYFTVKIPLV